MAKELLRKALLLCKQPFKGADTLVAAVDMSLKLLGMEFYVEVSKEEIEAIKQAMVSGPGGISTHSGHWYNCVNGHPVSLLSSILTYISDLPSLLSASAACLWKTLDARNVVHPLVDRTIRLSKVLHVLRTWSAKRKE